MARVHVIYDPRNQLQVPTDSWAQHMKVKIAVIDVPEDGGPKYIEETAQKLALRLMATFHEPNV